MQSDDHHFLKVVLKAVFTGLFIVSIVLVTGILCNIMLLVMFECLFMMNDAAFAADIGTLIYCTILGFICIRMALDQLRDNDNDYYD